MIALIQRVRQAAVQVDAQTVGAIAQGLLVLVCAEPSDTEAQAAKLVDKLIKLRIFADEAGKMNRSVADLAGGLLIVSQFTLAADTRSGNRPSFKAAASAELGQRLTRPYCAWHANDMATWVLWPAVGLALTCRWRLSTTGR